MAKGSLGRSCTELNQRVGSQTATTKCSACLLTSYMSESCSLSRTPPCHIAAQSDGAVAVKGLSDSSLLPLFKCQ